MALSYREEGLTPSHSNNTISTRLMLKLGALNFELDNYWETGIRETNRGKEGETETGKRAEEGKRAEREREKGERRRRGKTELKNKVGV